MHMAGHGIHVGHIDVVHGPEVWKMSSGPEEHEVANV
jgi:hypothetical protein